MTPAGVRQSHLLLGAPNVGCARGILSGCMGRSWMGGGGEYFLP